MKLSAEVQAMLDGDGQPGAEIALSYSRYLYGENVSLRSKQIPGNPPPDEHTWKLQAQVAW